jgi:hypothetical protein
MAKLSFMNVIFEYKASDLTQYYRIQYFDKNNREIKNPEIPYGLKSSGIISENEFWPKHYTFDTKGCLHRASVFSPKNNEFYYYYNLNETDKLLIENSLSNDNWTHSWKYTTHTIINPEYSENVITAFWWIKTEQIYFSIEEIKEKSRIGKINFIRKLNAQNNTRKWFWFPVSLINLLLFFINYHIKYSLA